MIQGDDPCIFCGANNGAHAFKEKWICFECARELMIRLSSYEYEKNKGGKNV